MDNDWYPLPETLAKIQAWEINSYADCEALLVWVHRVWKWDNYFTASKRRERSHKGGRLYRKYHVSTGGWSGHEEIMTTLENNWHFWSLAWYSSRRGGHYEFRV